MKYRELFKQKSTMAEKKTNAKKTLPVKNIAGARSDQEKWLRVFSVLLLLLAFLAVLTALVYGAKRWFFTGNPRFTIRQIELQNSGFWQDKEQKLSARLGLHRGDNLFAVQPAVLRERLLRIPSVERCEVIRVLPDTVRLRVIERIPRAVLANPRSEWVVDENGIVIPRLESMSVSLPLPVILGISTAGLTPGMKLEPLREALALIMQTVRNFPDISIVAVNLRDPEKLEFVMRYRGRKVCKVFIPARNRNLAYLLSVLQTAIIDAERSGEPGSTFDLSFNGNVIVR